MLYKKILAFLLALCLLFSLSACKKEEEVPEIPEEPVDPNFPITLELVNDTVTLYEAPNSIVSLSPALTTLLHELDEDSVLDGVSSYAPDFAEGKSDCGTAQNIDLKAVKDILPDLLLTGTILLDHQLTALQQMDVEVLYLPRPQSEQELYDRAELILLALYGKEDGANKAKEVFETWDEAWEPLKMFSEEEKVSALMMADLDVVATGDVWEGQLLDSLSLNNLAANGTDWQLPQIQTAEDGTKTYLYGETAVDWNPAVIFYNSDLDVESIKTNELYTNSEAAQNEALYPIDWSVLQLQNEELPGLLASMVEKVYPEQWEEVLDVIAERKAAEEAAAQEAAEAENTTEETKSEK